MVALTHRTRWRLTLGVALTLAVQPACTAGQVRTAPPAPPPVWDRLVGEYASDADTLSVLENAGSLLLLTWGTSRPEALIQLRDSTFRIGAGPRQAVFRGAGPGPAPGLMLGGREHRRIDLAGPDQQFRVAPARPLDALRGEAARATPPKESGDFLPSDLVDLTALDATLRLDIRYATSRNFLGTPVYTSARAFLQRPAAEALVRAHRGLAPLGYGLLIHDGYRPWSVSWIFWEATPVPLRRFVADPAQGSRHNRGCAVDLTLFDLGTGKPVVMPGGYDEMSPRSGPDWPGGTARQRWHRDLLRRAMEAEGFTVYEHEWWHFDCRDWRRYRIGNQPFEHLGR